MDKKTPNPNCKDCIDRFNDKCEGSKISKDVGDECPCYRSEKETKLTNPKDTVGSNKMPFHLCPSTITKIISRWTGKYCSPVVRLAITLPLLEGCLKYGRSNYRVVGVRASIYYDAFYRHINSHMLGEIIDKDSGFPHLFKALACLSVLVEAELAGKLNDDRMVEGGYEKLEECIEVVDTKLDTVCDLLDTWFEGIKIENKSCLTLAICWMADVIDDEYKDYNKLIKEYTPMIKELKEKYKDKNPKHYTIKDNK